MALVVMRRAEGKAVVSMGWRTRRLIWRTCSHEQPCVHLLLNRLAIVIHRSRAFVVVHVGHSGIM